VVQYVFSLCEALGLIPSTAYTHIHTHTCTYTYTHVFSCRNRKYLLFHSYCGSGIWLKLTWVPLPLHSPQSCRSSYHLGLWSHKEAWPQEPFSWLWAGLSSFEATPSSLPHESLHGAAHDLAGGFYQSKQLREQEKASTPPKTKTKNQLLSPAHACNPSYLGGWDGRPAWANSSQEPHLQNNQSKNRVPALQVRSPKFKPQSHQRKRERERPERWKLESFCKTLVLEVTSHHFSLIVYIRS
jgi:hypothetical protein